MRDQFENRKRPAQMPIESELDLDALLHPAKAFAHPMDVVRDPDLTLNEKRAILASWASDACAVEATPELRSVASGNLVRWDGIMDALKALDEEHGYGTAKRVPHFKRVLRKRDLGRFQRRSGSSGRNDRGASA